MSCACIENDEGTAILRPCRLHAAWAKTRAAQTWGDVDDARQPQPAPGKGAR